MSNGEYLYANKDRACFIKLKNKITYINCSGFKAFVDKVTEKNLFDDILIDISEAENIDSTNLGLIARLGEFIHEKRKKAVIVYSGNDLFYLLRSVGFDYVFDVVSEKNFIEEELKEIKTESHVDNIEMGKILVDAHKTLVKMNARNEAVYSDVVKLLETNLEKQQAQRKK